MAASVRIEDEAFCDPRFDVLGALCGYNRYEAMGRMAHVWRYCTERNTDILAAAIVNAILGFGGSAAIVTAELGEQLELGIRIRGSHGRRREWHHELQQARQLAGLKRVAGAKRDEKGRLVSSSTPADVQHTSSTHPADIQQPTSLAPAESSVHVHVHEDPTKNLGGDLGESAPAETPPQKRAPRAKPKSALPVDFQPDASKLPNGFDYVDQLAQFRDYHTANATLSADWHASWRTWCRNAPRFARAGPNSRGANGGGYTVEMQLERVRMLEEQERSR